ncbi:MAG TPA: cupin domain-containing protein [Kofleriaceae bacterium]
MTSGELQELLPLYALGILEADEATTVERAVAADARLATELSTYQETAGQICAVTRPVAPGSDVFARLLASVGHGRFDAFATRMAKLFDVAVERARELLGLIERPASWVPQIPGISLVHFDGGPAVAAADCGFVRLEPGATFPPHSHLGEELVTILSGQVRDATNDRVLGPGEDYLQVEGSLHYLVCVGDEPCIYASRATNGIALGGVRVRPMTR